MDFLVPVEILHYDPAYFSINNCKLNCIQSKLSQLSFSKSNYDMIDSKLLATNLAEVFIIGYELG